MNIIYILPIILFSSLIILIVFLPKQPKHESEKNMYKKYMSINFGPNFKELGEKYAENPQICKKFCQETKNCNVYNYRESKYPQKTNCRAIEADKNYTCRGIYNDDTVTGTPNDEPIKECKPCERSQLFDFEGVKPNPDKTFFQKEGNRCEEIGSVCEGTDPEKYKGYCIEFNQQKCCIPSKIWCNWLGNNVYWQNLAY